MRLLRPRLTRLGRRRPDSAMRESGSVTTAEGRSRVSTSWMWSANRIAYEKPSPVDWIRSAPTSREVSAASNAPGLERGDVGVGGGGEALEVLAHVVGERPGVVVEVGHDADGSVVGLCGHVRDGGSGSPRASCGAFQRSNRPMAVLFSLHSRSPAKRDASTVGVRGTCAPSLRRNEFPRRGRPG